MLIRSQNKAVLLNFSNLAAIYAVKDGDDFIISSIEGENKCALGKYSTKVKAIKVLDMIQEAYADFEATKCISTGLLAIPYSKRFVCEEEQEKAHTAIRECADMLKKAYIFQMPDDGSVEV